MASRRRIRFHRRLSLSLALAISIIIAFLVVRKSDILPKQLSKYINEHYLTDKHFRFDCSGVSGDLVNNVSLTGVSIVYVDGDRRTEVFRAQEISLDYSIFEVLKMNLIIDELSLVGARLRVMRNVDGELLLPFGLPGERSGPIGLPHIEIRRFDIEDLGLRFEDSNGNFVMEDFRATGSLAIEGDSGSLEIEQCNAYIPDPGSRVQSLRLEILGSKEGLQLKTFVVRLDRTYLMASGGYAAGKLDHLQLIFNPLDLREISSLGVLPRTEGELGGSVVLQGPTDSLSVEGSVTGKAFGLALSGFSFSGSLTRDRFVLDRTEGGVFGSFVAGRFEYRSGPGGGYSYSGYSRDLDISEGFIPGEAVPVTDLNGRVELHYDRASDVYRFEMECDTSSISGFRCRNIRASGEWRGGKGLSIGEIVFQEPGFRIGGRGTVDERGVSEFLFTLVGDELDHLWDFLALPRIEGGAKVQGRVKGPMGDLTINLNGSVFDGSFLFARLDSASISAQITHVPGPESMAEVDLRGTHLDIGGKSFQDPHILLTATHGMVDVEDFRFSRGDSLFRADFSYHPGAERSLVHLKHLFIRMDSDTWISSGESTIRIEGKIARFDTVTVSSGEGTLEISGMYDSGKDLVDLVAHGRKLSAGLLNEYLGIPVRLEGLCRLEATVSGSRSDPSFHVGFRMRDGRLNGVSFRSIDLKSGYDGKKYRLEKLLVACREGSLLARGEWGAGDSPAEIVREGGARHLGISPMSVAATFSGFPMSDLARVFGKNLRLDPLYTGELVVGGTPERMRFSLRGSAEPGGEGRIRFPRTELSVAYEDGLLDLISLRFEDGVTKGSIEGRVPVELDFGQGARLEEHAPATLNIEIRSIDLSVLAEYLGEVEEASGSLYGDLTLSGTLARPRLAGELNVSRGGLRLFGMEERYRDIEARFVFRDSVIELSSLSCREGDEGRITGRGSLELSGMIPRSYRADLVLDEFLFQSLHDFISLQDGNVSVSSLGEGVAPLTPSITGSLRIKQAIVTRSFQTETGPPSPLTIPTENPGWFCELELHAPKKIFVRNPGLNMELGGDVILKRDRSGLYLRGELSVLRGSYTLYNNKFRITDGVFDFSAAAAFRPEINLNAYTLYRRGGEEHRIFLNLSWPRDRLEPLVTLSSDEPGYSETDIWKMLGGTYVSSAPGRGNGAVWDAAGTAQGLASGYLERVLNTRMQDLTIDVESRVLSSPERAGGTEHEMMVAVGKYLSEDLYLQYRQGLSIATEREVDIEYRLGRMFVMRTQIIRHSGSKLLGKSSQATDEINLDIKLRFEY